MVRLTLGKKENYDVLEKGDILRSNAFLVKLLELLSTVKIGVIILTLH